jgi:hypothetical protein
MRGFIHILAICLLGWCTLAALTRVPTTSIAGEVRGACAVVSHLPDPIASAVTGEFLRSGTLSTPLGTGTCTVLYWVRNLPVLEFYVIRVGDITGRVSSAYGADTNLVVA